VISQPCFSITWHTSGSACCKAFKEEDYTMQKLYVLAAGALLSAAAALPAVGADPEAASQPRRPATLQEPERQASAQQQVSGNVQEIDRTKGLMTLASSVGTLRLHFPPRFLSEIQKGQIVTAQYSFAKFGEESKLAYDAPLGFGAHQMAGTVEDVNHDTGWIRVKSDATMLELAFPPRVVSDIKSGDRITVDLAFSTADSARQ
jgi:hypothetical protein